MRQMERKIEGENIEGWKMQGRRVYVNQVLKSLVLLRCLNWQQIPWDILVFELFFSPLSFPIHGHAACQMLPALLYQKMCSLAQLITHRDIHTETYTHQMRGLKGSGIAVFDNCRACSVSCKAFSAHICPKCQPTITSTTTCSAVQKLCVCFPFSYLLFSSTCRRVCVCDQTHRPSA